PLHQGPSCVHVTRTVRRLLCQKNRSKLVSHDQMGIQSHSDIEKGSKRLVFLCTHLVLTAEILDDSRPVNIRQQAGISQAQLLDCLGGRNKQGIMERVTRAEAVNDMQRANCPNNARERNHQCDQKNLAAHFKFLNSKIITDPLTTTVT